MVFHEKTQLSLFWAYLDAFQVHADEHKIVFMMDLWANQMHSELAAVTEVENMQYLAKL